MAKKMTQKEKVLQYCAEHGSITAREAFNLNINSPRKVISDIRHSGHYDVQSVEETRKNKSGEIVHFTRYFIKEVATNG